MPNPIPALQRAIADARKAESVTQHIPISRDLADAILCEVKFRQSRWYRENISPYHKQVDRQIKDPYERALLRRDFVYDLIQNA